MGLNVRWKLQRKLACVSILFLWLLTSTYGKGYFPKLVDLAEQKSITATSTCGATASSYCQSSKRQGSLQACSQQTCKFDCCADCGSSKPNSSDLAAVSDKVRVTQDGDPKNGSIVRSFRFQSDSYIQPLRIPPINYVKPGFTISVWIKQKQGNKGTIISKNVTTQPSTNTFQLIIQDYNLMFHYKPVTGNASVASYTLLQSQSEKLQPNEWHLITVAVINKGLSYYIDGELMNANVATLTGPISDQRGTVVIGQKYGGSDQYEGLMQDIHVYARGLTNREAEEAFTGVLPVAYVASNCRCPPSHPKIDVAEPAKCLKNLEGDLDTVARLADTAHPIEFATDGDTQSFWLSKVTENVTINIDLSYSGLQVFYIVLTFYGPVPAGIKIERSLNNGKTFQPWQYFAENCSSFHLPNNGPLTEPDSVNCVQYDKPLKSTQEVITFRTEYPPPPGSNIPVRPFGQGCSNLYCSQSLLQFLKATHVKFHFYNHTLVQNSQHRYFGLERIHVAGRCDCFGHASSSSYIEGNATHPGRCVCDCHSSTNTEGETCNRCKPLYNNKPFQRGDNDQDDSYPCVKCECNQHADSCVYNQSVDTSPNSRTQDGGGVCINCKHNTSGRFCQMCKKKFYRESAKSLKAADVCSPCGCEGPGVQPGNLDCVKDDSNSNIIAGQCECKANTQGRQCNVCKDGFFDLKAGHATGCVACGCTLDGTKNRNSSCHATTGQCDCKDRVTGTKCDTCKSGYYSVSGQEPLGCKTCDCDPFGTTAGNVSTCNPVTGQCSCKPGVIGRKCDQCEDEFHSLTQNGCTSCNCSVAGTQPSLLDACDKSTGSCDCKVNVQGNNCDQCKQGFYNLSESNPQGCTQCMCNSAGSVGKNCNDTGHCTCKANVEGRQCDRCIDDYYGFGNCAPCNCNPASSLNSQCDGSGNCTCKKNAEGDKCDEIIKSIDIIWMIVPIVLSLLLLVVFAVVVIRKNRRRNQNNNRIRHQDLRGITPQFTPQGQLTLDHDEFQDLSDERRSVIMADSPLSMPESSLHSEQTTSVRNLPRGISQPGTRESLVLTTFQPEMSTVTPRSISQGVLPSDQHTATVMSSDQSNQPTSEARTRLAQLYQKHSYQNDRITTIPYQNTIQPTESTESSNPRVLSDDEWEVSHDHLSLFKRIGGGSFGQVWKGAMLDVAGAKGWSIVAVKMLKENSSKSDLKDLLSELDLLKKLKPHPNVIRLLGCFTQDFNQHEGRREFKPPLVVLEFVPYGDLLGYLRKSRGEADSYYNYLKIAENPRKIPKEQLYRFASDIARGMEFISAHQLIHRDLAARNVLVGEGLCCKITDFGMARDLGKSDIYIMRSNGLVPVIWMAVESLRSQIFTTASDVWSYGVVLYEIFTLGGRPYEGLTGEEVFNYVASGGRLPRTPAMSSELYNHMLQCWHEEPSERPTFTLLASWTESLAYDQY